MILRLQLIDCHSPSQSIFQARDEIIVETEEKPVIELAETASGSNDDRPERKAVLALAQSREIDVILVAELTQWGRSTLDLFHTLNDLQSWGVSIIAQMGLQFDLSTSQGKLIAAMMSALAEFERDCFGNASRQIKLHRKVLSLVNAGRSCRQIGRQLNISKNTVPDIVKRARIKEQ